MNCTPNDDGGPAFPRLYARADEEGRSGMTLRDWFAGQAIGPLMASDGFEQRILSDRSFPIESLPEFAADQAYAIADAMLAARKKGSQ